MRVTSSSREMKTLMAACDFSLLREASKNSALSFLIQRDAASLEVGAQTTLVRERTYPWEASAWSGLNL